MIEKHKVAWARVQHKYYELVHIKTKHWKQRKFNFRKSGIISPSFKLIVHA